MNTLKIIEAARTILPDLVEVNKNVYRGTLNIEDKIAGVCFIDLENDKKENFEDYQEKLISKEFYSNPGALQWNYYLFLLNDQLSDSEVLDIESDDKYARKYVLDEKEFVEFFKIEESQKVTQPNIVSEWKKALQEVDLQEVYTEETYVGVFERFASNQTIKEVATSLTKGGYEVAKIQFINKLILKDNYRAYPKTHREFNFGKVNLFKGINGVGKTSVFEGIELMLCGKTFRNVNQNNPNGCLEAVFNGAAKAEQYQGTNQAVYQSRDLKWYSSTYNRGNNLYNSFNRFNYFNADAAHSFASSKTEGDVMDALYSIVLGPEFGYIQERCTKMIERIRPEYNRLRDSIDTANGETIADKKLVDAYVEPESVHYIREKIKAEVKALGFRQQDLDIAAGQTQIEDLNSQIGIALQNLAERNFQYDSLADFNSAVAKFNAKKQTFEGLLENVKSLGQASTVILNVQKELEKNLGLLEKSLDYLADVRYLELDGLAVKLKDQHYIKSKTDFVSGLVKDIDLEKFKSSTQIGELELAERNSLETLRRDSLALRESINGELEKMGKVDALIKELKAKGAEYLQAAPLATECPLCSTNFERDLLEQRINLLLGSDQLQVNKFQEDNSRLAKWAEDQIIVEKRLAIFEKIKNAYQSFFGLDAPLGTMTEILTEIKDVMIRSEGLNKELDRLKSVENFGAIAGRSESELSDLKTKISQVFTGELEFNLDKIELFKARHSALEKELADKKTELEKNISDRYNKGLEIKLLLGLPTEAPTDAKAAEQKLESENKNLDLYAGYMERIKILVELQETAKFSELKNKSDILRLSIQSLKDSLNAEFLVKQARERIMKNKKILTENTPKRKRFEKAYNRLLELTSGEDTKRVEEFFKNNLKEVIDIFKSIHVPREFSDLKFENKRLTLINDDKNDQRYITEISTGQRSALALSIFLSLNNKLANGPDLILFDDPVAFIDDLNALSFLDYLRLHVLKSRKQIFFATANTRLAHLFEKKFAFLGEDFKQWHLERN
jgi:DNA repair protein SbcC/Rad50